MTSRLQRALHRVQACAIDAAEAQERQRAAVADARAAGATWEDIGRFLGITRHAAARRYGQRPAKDEPDDQLPLF
ncbi:hypothetical protein C1Y63_04300 [Corynebacterium sp. 13CS0277]|uniref:helix-turn-helix domain-containing protein n=1 Tax=Corynebacterium sp. 13CS0277 TaxID=2071994 RepID=UPI000D0274E4|nr:helix-turn-helix domain-containing protein [Corynebacterium sp. 13CS0277]PRQ11867.1 hypothetical protein C1Y63_04300 [Corynebacterium sp. 13CS0277]